MTGRTISHYEITEEIGEGGMDVVYKARDTNVGRDVAIKVLSQAFARDDARMERFQREARTLASLNHPNIAAIHGIEEADGTHAIVMELAAGEMLADRLSRGAIPLAEVMPITRQIAEAGLSPAPDVPVQRRAARPGYACADCPLQPVVRRPLSRPLARAGSGQPGSQDPTPPRSGHLRTAK